MPSRTPLVSPHAALRIGIAGAGPAGLAAAIALARHGHHVDVYEKHPQLAPKGAGILIQPQGLAALRALGVRTAFDAVSVPIHRLVAASHRGWRLVDIDYGDDPARAVGRPALASVLYEAALAAGARVHFAHPVEAVAAHAEGARLRLAAAAPDTPPPQHSFDFCVLADGAASLLREQMGLADPSVVYRWGALHGQFWVDDWDANHVLQQRCRGTGEMMGLMPTRLDGRRTLVSLFWSMAHSRYAQWRAASLDDWKAHVLTLWPQAHGVLDQIRSHTDLELAVYRHTWPKRLAMPACCVVGDAAHAMSPQLGLGTTLAVQDALALAESVAAHGAAAGLQAYARKRLRPSQGYQTLSRILTPCFQAQGQGWLRDAMFVLGRRIPGVQWAMKRSLSQGPRALARAERAARETQQG
jgi:2-polyprenyl-6-methoxyphenol hydroxylase-like FAD-dependent oxidoreductase